MKTVTLIPSDGKFADYNRITITVSKETDTAWYGRGNPNRTTDGEFPKYAWKEEVAS